MSAVRMLPALAPLVAVAVAVWVLRPKRDPDRQVTAPIRLAVLRAAVVVATVAVTGVELLSTVERIDAVAVSAFWLAVVALGGVLAWLRRGPLPVGSLTGWWGRTTRVERALLAGLGVLVLAELVLGLASSPNNYDSNHYHLPKIEHWVANRDVDVYATIQLPQVVLVPGAEYLLLHLRLLTGGEALYHLLQWGAGLLGAVAVSRCAAQLGAGRLGQLLAAAVFATTPAVVLQTTSTQNDLIVSTWVVCAASLALDGVGRRTRPGEAILLGAAAGLVAVTKSTGLMALAVVLTLWGLAQLRLGVRVLAGTFGASATIVAVALMLVGPFMLRMEQTFGAPLGPEQHRRGLSVQRHDVPAVLVNALRIGASTLVVPLPPVNAAVADGVKHVSRVLDVDPQDPSITLWRSTYPNPKWNPDEDHSPYPIQSGLLLLALGVALFGRRVPSLPRAYATAVLVAMLLTAAVLKWQTWGNRLVLPVLVLGVPLVGWWLGRLPQRSARSRWRAVTAAAVALVMCAGFASAYGSVLLGWPRRLVGAHSVFVLDDLQERFVRGPNAAVVYRTAADRVKASGAKRVGLVMEGDAWEYPLWVLLPGHELRSLRSAVPGAPPTPVSEVDAIICVSEASTCRSLAPADWRHEQLDSLVAVVLPPG